MSKKLGEVNENSTNVIAKKRGRKSKKEIEEAQKILNQNIECNISENIIIKIEENVSNIDDNMKCIDEVINSDNDNDNDNHDKDEEINDNHLSEK